jgi:hypothetical protein
MQTLVTTYSKLSRRRASIQKGSGHTAQPVKHLKIKRGWIWGGDLFMRRRRGDAAGDNGAEARAFFFHAIEETPRPSKFSGKNTQCEQNREPARTRGEYQRDTQAEERKSQNDLQDSLCGFDRPRKHLSPRSLSYRSARPSFV